MTIFLIITTTLIELNIIYVQKCQPFILWPSAIWFTCIERGDDCSILLVLSLYLSIFLCVCFCHNFMVTDLLRHDYEFGKDMISTTTTTATEIEKLWEILGMIIDKVRVSVYIIRLTAKCHYHGNNAQTKRIARIKWNIKHTTK